MSVLLGSLGVALALILGAAPACAQTLAEVVERMLETNPEASSALASLRATYEEVAQAKSGLLPTVDVRVASGREQTSNVFLNPRKPTLDRRESSVTLRQLIFDAYGVQSEIDRQNARVLSFRNRAVDTFEQLAQRAAETYTQLLREREQLVLARANVETHRETARLVELRYKNGVGTRADVEQALARIASAQSVVVNREGNRREAEERYRRVIGQAPGALAPAPELGSRLPGTLETLLEEVRNGHPRVLQAMSDLDAGKAQRRGAQSAYFPRFDFELGANRNRNLDGVAGPNNDITAMVVMRYNVFRGGGDAARDRELQERETALTADIESARRAVSESVAVAWVNIATARDTAAMIERQVNAVARVRESYIDQFELGRRTLLDLLNTENELFNAKANLLSARYDIKLAEYRTLGGAARLLPALGLAQRGYVPGAEPGVAPEPPATPASPAPAEPAPRKPAPSRRADAPGMER